MGSLVVLGFVALRIRRVVAPIAIFLVAHANLTEGVNTVREQKTCPIFRARALPLNSPIGSRAASRGGIAESIASRASDPTINRAG